MADKYAQGRVVTTHEGGYSEVYVPFCGLAVLEAFLGKSSGIIDPMATGSDAATRKDQQLLAHQKEMIDECKKTHKL
jgi:acetoin utilization deacetylase AcuC-like enzyme